MPGLKEAVTIAMFVLLHIILNSVNQHSNKNIVLPLFHTQPEAVSHCADIGQVSGHHSLDALAPEWKPVSMQ
jgi:hypothetical protein